MVDILVGDIGGTKTTLAGVSPERGPRDLLDRKMFPSTQFSSLEAIIEEYLAGTDLPIDRAVFGIAGPVREGGVRTTNLSWHVEEARLAEAFGLSSVCFMNDLEAMAAGVLHLDESELVALNKGKAVKGGAIAVIAPGTGLGEAFLVREAARYKAFPSEGGHVDFAPKSLPERDLLTYLTGQFGHVSYERACSGPGISHIYSFMKRSGYGEEPAWLSTELSAAGDRTPVIVNAALDEEKPCELCARALDQFVSILGAEAGNLALKVLATGGVYIGGGIAPRILPFLQKEILMESFRDKGRYTQLMERIPVHVILNPHVALFGMAAQALER
jgi:glucokinase